MSRPKTFEISQFFHGSSDRRIKNSLSPLPANLTLVSKNLRGGCITPITVVPTFWSPGYAWKSSIFSYFTRGDETKHVCTNLVNWVGIKRHVKKWESSCYKTASKPDESSKTKEFKASSESNVKQHITGIFFLQTAFTGPLKFLPPNERFSLTNEFANQKKDSKRT